MTDILHRIRPPFRKEEETMKLAAKLVLVCALATIVLATPSPAAVWKSTSFTAFLPLPSTLGRSLFAANASLG